MNPHKPAWVSHIPHLHNLLWLQDLDALLPWGSRRAPRHRWGLLRRRRRHVGRRFEAPEAQRNVAVVAVAGVAIHQSSRIRRGHGGGRLHWPGGGSGGQSWMMFVVGFRTSGLRLALRWVFEAIETLLMIFLGVGNSLCLCWEAQGLRPKYADGPPRVAAPFRAYLACGPGTSGARTQRDGITMVLKFQLMEMVSMIVPVENDNCTPNLSWTS